VLANLSQLVRHRELLWVWTTREVRVRYKQSVLGAAWAILQPLALSAMFTLVFSYVVRVPTDGIPYPIFSYTALVPWTFLSSAINLGVPSLVNNMNLITRIYFPREILPLASIAAAGIDFGVAALVLAGMMMWYHMPLHPALLLLPVLVLIQAILAFGATLLGAAALVFFRDVRFIVPLFLQLWLYASPVIYPVSQIPAQWRPIYQLNPMVGVLESYRDILLRQRWPDPAALASAALIALALFVLGYWLFKRLEPRFADLI